MANPSPNVNISYDAFGGSMQSVCKLRPTRLRSIEARPIGQGCCRCILVHCAIKSDCNLALFAEWICPSRTGQCPSCAGCFVPYGRHHLPSQTCLSLPTVSFASAPCSSCCAQTKYLIVRLHSNYSILGSVCSGVSCTCVVLAATQLHFKLTNWQLLSLSHTQ